MSNLIKPALGEGRTTSCIISEKHPDSTPVDLDAEGTIDWVYLGDQSHLNIPWLMGATSPARKNTGPGHLWRGFNWLIQSGGWVSFNQNIGRFLTAGASVNSRGDALNNDNSVGYFANAAGEMLNNGFSLFLPAGFERQRLTMYTSTFDAHITTRARILNSDFDDGKDLIETASYTIGGGTGGDRTHRWIIDFCTHTPGLLHVDCTVTTMLSINSNIRVQGFTLAPTP